jgi:hypothetical protein
MDVRPSSEVLQQTEGKGFQNQHIQFESEAGIEIDARLYFRIHPAEIRQYCCWPVSCPICWRQRSRRREEWCWFSNRGILSRMTIGGPYVGNWLANTRAEQIGVSLPGRRAHDILGGVDLLCSRKDVDPGSIRAGGQGVKGIWLLLAAAADPRIQKVWLTRRPTACRSASKYVEHELI